MSVIYFGVSGLHAWVCAWQKWPVPCPSQVIFIFFIYFYYFNSIYLIKILLCLILWDVFVGGVYGFARGLIGPYIGFLVGICEFVGNIVLLGTLSIAFGQSVSTTLGLHDLYILPFFLVPLAIAALLQYTGSKHFGFVVKYLSLLSVVLFAIYVFGSMAHVSFPRYGNNSHGHPSSMTHKINQALSSSNFGCSFFIGMESIPVISSAAKKVFVLFFIPLFTNKIECNHLLFCLLGIRSHTNLSRGVYSSQLFSITYHLRRSFFWRHGNVLEPMK